jgi:biopolymer transport protein ExbB
MKKALPLLLSMLKADVAELLNNLFHVELLLENGGIVLWLILFASILMWTLIMERYIFLYWLHPKQGKEIIGKWIQRQDRRSWYAKQIRRGLIVEQTMKLEQHLLLIKTLIVALPMLGLLGTVDGMIQTFDVMAVHGTGNARGMAGGISIALITTMGGLLTSLSGLYFSTQLEQRVARQGDKVADALRWD